MAFEIENNQNPLSSRKIFGEETIPKMTGVLQKVGISSERTAFKILVGITITCFLLAIYITITSLDTFVEPKTGQVIVNETPDATTR